MHLFLFHLDVLCTRTVSLHFSVFITLLRPLQKTQSLSLPTTSSGLEWGHLKRRLLWLGRIWWELTWDLNSCLPVRTQIYCENIITINQLEKALVLPNIYSTQRVTFRRKDLWYCVSKIFVFYLTDRDSSLILVLCRQARNIYWVPIAFT